jgi:hypothetical protein
MRSSPNTTASHLLRRYRASVGRRGHVFSQGPSPAWHRWKRIFCIPAEYACGWDLHGVHEITNEQCFGGVLTFYLVATAWATARRRDAKTGILDWVCASGGIGARYLGPDLRGGGREQLNRGERWNPCGNVLFPWLRRSAFCRGGRSYALARRCFWRAAYCAASVADVLCGVYRLFLLVFGTATSVPGVIAQDGDSFSAGCPAADLDDFLAGSRVVHECVQKDFVTKPSSWEPAWGPQASLASS